MSSPEFLALKYFSEDITQTSRASVLLGQCRKRVWMPSGVTGQHIHLALRPAAVALWPGCGFIVIVVIIIIIIIIIYHHK
eukprot:4408249-Amphidinium_carterae.1